jgi:hypothetical protein
MGSPEPGRPLSAARAVDQSFKPQTGPGARFL